MKEQEQRSKAAAATSSAVPVEVEEPKVEEKAFNASFLNKEQLVTKLYLEYCVLESFGNTGDFFAT